MADEQKPRKVGVYDGSGGGATSSGMNWMWIILGLIVVAIVLYLLLR
ncbi:hypothetical protein [Azospirillum picis]|uniref:Sporulation protein YjcZ n=1 Tax=Azospirillum picis TaxID=488438 RepID=A0ABU0MEU5_9PROT|nr:hypothetical protein [Azospirillum picis]MBP2298118.1 hypothetical protein [Azospirillum picis]MDQ0531956.1 hypothetical protein [Azospirillum picis]